MPFCAFALRLCTLCTLCALCALCTRCISAPLHLYTYTPLQDGENRLEAEKKLQELDAQAAFATGKTGTPLRAASVADTFSNSEFNARLNGLDPDSPYVTQRPQQAYFWYKTSEANPNPKP